MCEEEDLLSIFLNSAQEELAEENQPPNTQRQLKEIDILCQETNTKQPVATSSTSERNLSIIHSGDTDSSDDEGNKYFENTQYNNCGKSVKSQLKTQTNSLATTSTHAGQSNGWTSSIKKAIQTQERLKREESQFVTDPISGIRIINPLVSSTLLKERMVGREAVPLNKITFFIQKNGTEKDFVVSGVIVGTSATRTSQKGSQYLIWTLSDLKDDIKTVSVFLFANAFKELCKTAVGTVVGILNPSLLEKNSKSKDEATLSVANSQKVMIFGQSKDFGTCKSTKKNGDKCNSVVNLGKCEYCVYHIKQEYNNFSRRSDLVGNPQGRGLMALQNKLLGKNEVFYAGKSYTAVPAKRSQKLEKMDENRLQLLDGCLTANVTAPKKRSKKPQTAAVLQVSHAQRLRDLELLRKLEGKKDTIPESGTFEGQASTDVTIDDSKATALSVVAKLKAKKDSSVESKKSVEENVKKSEPIKSSNVIPTLSGATSKNGIDLNIPISRKHVTHAKLNALNYVQRFGKIKKTDPNSTKSPTTKKRSLETDPDAERFCKKLKVNDNQVISDRFKKMMAATSKHADLLDDYDNEQQEKYFKKLEKKEAMEEKMINTFKVACKAVRCLKCKYTNFSASDLCKNERHPLKVFDTEKRFFKCGDCGYRTVCLEIVPVKACKKCGSGKWEKTGMMKEKIVKNDNGLSLRGDEEQFYNSVATNANLNLLVPE